ncbi:hypothetical protein [Mycoplasmopsis alligatoris]|uniref:Uncharacterized protein n=1 Tax=Mycoplasmopsis alligatoris A21JP2 TaxID=747682 RepID=D4XX17_9BACT|nr:hypothetical protein [Mycoplasmopsis alligatoris]EFF41155.1 hypothetical protein MALL_0246 [Mycoplasmopsis alligatoris A21JP2]
MIEHVNLQGCACPACMQSVLVVNQTDLPTNALTNTDIAIIAISVILIIVLASAFVYLLKRHFKNKHKKVI